MHEHHTDPESCEMDTAESCQTPDMPTAAEIIDAEMEALAVLRRLHLETEALTLGADDIASHDPPARTIRIDVAPDGNLYIAVSSVGIGVTVPLSNTARQELWQLLTGARRVIDEKRARVQSAIDQHRAGKPLVKGPGGVWALDDSESEPSAPVWNRAGDDWIIEYGGRYRCVVALSQGKGVWRWWTFDRQTNAECASGASTDEPTARRAAIAAVPMEFRIQHASKVISSGTGEEGQ